MKTRKLRKNIRKPLRKRGGQATKRKLEDTPINTDINMDTSSLVTSLSSSQRPIVRATRRLAPTTTLSSSTNIETGTTLSSSSNQQTEKLSPKLKKFKSDFDNPLQHLIHAIGDHNILVDFAQFNGRDGCQVMEKSSRVSGVPNNFIGIAFDGGHWKGYEKQEQGTPRIVYDSYVYNIQRPASNNYCQSYATVLWAKRGLQNTNFKPNEMVENVKKMSQLWLAYFDSVMNSNQPAYKKWLMDSINEGSNESQRVNEGSYTYEEIRQTLQNLVNDIELRTTFANSY